MVKIGFCGSFNSNKTKNAIELAKQNNYTLIQNASKKCPHEIGENISRDAQLYIISEQLHSEIKAQSACEKDNIKGIVCDGTILDPIVYSLSKNYTDLVDMFMPFAHMWWNTYSTVYWCHPKVDVVNYKSVWKITLDRLYEKFSLTFTMTEVNNLGMNKIQKSTL